MRYPVVGVSTEFELLKLITCSLYHENLLLQKFNDMITQVLKLFFSASDIMEAVRGRFCFLWYEGCMIQESYCCAVGIGQQAQTLEYLLRAVGTGTHLPPPPSFG